MARAFYSKRERLADRLSLGSLRCPECEIESFTLTDETEEKMPILECIHCKGKYAYIKETDNLLTLQYDNIKPLYLEM